MSIVAVNLPYIVCTYTVHFPVTFASILLQFSDPARSSYRSFLVSYSYSYLYPCFFPPCFRIYKMKHTKNDQTYKLLKRVVTSFLKYQWS